MATTIPTDTVAFCRKCGTPLTQESRREWQGIPYCQPCLEGLQAAEQAAQQAAQEGPAAQPSGADAPPRPETPSGSFPRYAPQPRYTPQGGTVSPALAGILGFIPGVGAVYNGQYAKGILHVMLFGLLVSIVASDGTGDLRPMFVFLAILMAVYMPIEAYRTARAMERGEPIEEFSGILSVFGSKTPSPTGGVVLIALGVIFLFNTLGYWRLGDLVQYWPVLLIALGAFMLYRSVSEQAREDRLAGFGGGPGLGARRMDQGAPRRNAEADSVSREPSGSGDEAAEGGSSELRPSNG